MTQNNEARLKAADAEDVANNYQPVALKAVLAAALMLKRSVNGNKAKKAA